MTRPKAGRTTAGMSEREWVDNARNGSEAAMESLFRAYWPDAQRAAFLIVRDWAASEDIAQESFMAAIRALERFDRRRPFGPWFHRIVVNRAIDWSRARQSRREVPDQDNASHFSAEDFVESDPIARKQLLTALGDLSPEHRGVIVLRYLFDYTPGEISKMLKEPRGTINSRMRRALDRLAETVDSPEEVER